MFLSAVTLRNVLLILREYSYSQELRERVGRRHKKFASKAH